LTEGYACHNRACEYYGHTDSQVHALVADGEKLTRQGLVKQIKCQGCGSKFLVTRNTAMYRSKLTVERVGEINRGLAEGLSISACARVFGHSRSTIHRIARVSGDHFQSLHELLLQGIQAVHVQMDELRAKLKGKVEAVWTWVSMEATHKLMLAVEVGQRTQDHAYALVHKTVGCLAKGCIPTYATDGLNQYFYALSAHHGGWLGAETVLRAEGETGHRHRHTKRNTKRKGLWRVDPNLHYGQVIKRYARRKIKAITRQMMLGSQEAFRSALQAAGLSGRINTAYIERLNLGLRTGVSALIRRSASAVCCEAALARRVEIYRAIYHFVRPHAGLRLESPVPLLCSTGRSYRRFEPCTPAKVALWGAMAAGLTNRVWSMEQLLLHPVPPRTPPRHQPRRLSPAS
jgi:IS1 family transposase